MSGVINKVRAVLQKIPPETRKDLGMCARLAYQAARQAVSGAGGKSNIIIPRVIPFPKRGGILPQLPILGALGVIGSLAGGVSGLIKTIKEIRSGSALRSGGRLGRNVHLKPYKMGYGVYFEKYRGLPWSGI